MISRLESKLEEVYGCGSSLGPVTSSPTASTSTHDSSTDIFTVSQHEGGGGGEGGVGVGGEDVEVDVERWDDVMEGGGDEESVDLLLEDLQASSNSEDDDDVISDCGEDGT